MVSHSAALAVLAAVLCLALPQRSFAQGVQPSLDGNGGVFSDFTNEDFKCAAVV